MPRTSLFARSYGTGYVRRTAAPQRRQGAAGGSASANSRPAKPAAAHPAPPAGFAGHSTKPLVRATGRSLVLKREAIRKRPALRSPRRRPGRGTVLGLLAAVLFLFGIGVGVNGLRTNHTVVAQVKHLSQSAVAGDATVTPAAAPALPSETPPATAPQAYHVAANLPQTLRIPKIGVSARILRTAVNARNELGTPPNIFDTAWYQDSAKPGEAGAMLIDGHVSGPTQHGVFYSLPKLVKGDKITITRGDGKVFSYTVAATKVYDDNAVDMAALLTPVTDGRPGLNLITCTGKLDSTGTHFQQRLAVFATQD